MKALFFFLLLMTSVGCESPTTSVPMKYHVIHGRSIPKTAVYRVRVPENWIIQDHTKQIEDTTTPLCEFFIPSSNTDERVRITIHNFPTDQLEERVSPKAQIERWRRQFTTLDPTTTHMIPQSYAGFVGLLFEGSGIMKGSESSMLAWAMQLSPEHYSVLNVSQYYPVEQLPHIRQMRADYTIKATGSKALISQYKEEIISFAHSFELIDEVPS